MALHPRLLLLLPAAASWRPIACWLLLLSGLVSQAAAVTATQHRLLREWLLRASLSRNATIRGSLPTLPATTWNASGEDTQQHAREQPRSQEGADALLQLGHNAGSRPRPLPLSAALRQQRSGREKEALLRPAANDTISGSYWHKLNHVLGPGGVGPGSGALALPQAAARREVVVNELGDVEVSNVNETGDVTAAGHQKFLSDEALQSYDLKLGGRVLDNVVLAADNLDHALSGNVKPPHTQTEVNVLVNAPCPYSFFTGALRVSAPRCGVSNGRWTDDNGAVAMSWNVGGPDVRLSIKSIGNGYFGRVYQPLTYNSYRFELRNCQDVPIWLIDETIQKVNKMGLHVNSTTGTHDTEDIGTVYLYRYRIKYFNGTVAAETQQLRSDSSYVNFTRYRWDDTPETIAVASRVGNWQGKEWRDCHSWPATWLVEFPLPPAAYGDGGTLTDIRLAATAAINLMAIRDEDVASDGFQHQGQGYVYWYLVEKILLVVVVFFVLAGLFLWLRKQKRLKRLTMELFQFDQFFFPKHPSGDFNDASRIHAVW